MLRPAEIPRIEVQAVSVTLTTDKDEGGGFGRHTFTLYIRRRMTFLLDPDYFGAMLCYTNP